jgi:hypothetical protein
MLNMTLHVASAFHLSIAESGEALIEAHTITHHYGNFESGLQPSHLRMHSL